MTYTCGQLAAVLNTFVVFGEGLALRGELLEADDAGGRLAPAGGRLGGLLL